MVAPQPFFRPRGTPFSVLHRIRALCTAGHAVHLITYPFGEDIEMDGLTIHRAWRPPLIKDVKIGPSLAKLILDLPLYFSTVRALRTRTHDVLHSHEEAAFFCVGLARRFGLAHIYDMHSSLPHQLENFGKFNIGPARWLFRVLEKRVLASCDGLITICDDLAQIATGQIKRTPHAMIENTADDRRVFPPTDDDPRRAHGLEGKKIFLYAGTFEPYQGLDLLFAAFRIVAEQEPDAHLLMVGGTPTQVAQYRAFARDVEARVTFTGTVHPSCIPSLVEASDIIVSPRSTGTNTPLKIYNYLRTGRPLVATNMHTHTQTLTPEISLLVPPTPEGFAAGMLALAQDPARAQRLADAAKAYADREFSDDAYLAKVSALYDEALAGIPRSRR